MQNSARCTSGLNYFIGQILALDTWVRRTLQVQSDGSLKLNGKDSRGFGQTTGVSLVIGIEDVKAVSHGVGYTFLKIEDCHAISEIRTVVAIVMV
jgi:hypothetical protein